MKNKFAIVLCVATVILSGCVKEDNDEIKELIELQEDEIQTEENQIEELQTDDTQTDDIQINDIQDTESNTLDDSVYIGEYLDYDCNEPNLEIARGEDGKYIVQIGIFRLTTLDDGVGELTPEGMVFTATDAAGNPISGIITVEEQIATVTFTDSTWDLLENGTSYTYSKSSDVANIWGE